MNEREARARFAAAHVAHLASVRADSRARIVGVGPELERAVALVLERYPQEREHPPAGPALAVEIERWPYWSQG